MEMVLLTHHDDGTTLITINRPERRNAICAQTAIELQQAFAEFDRSAQKVAVVTGTGDDAFSSGADVSKLPELWRCIPTLGITTEKPVIAAVAGHCVGGALVMTMMCDLLVAADNAKFSYPEAALGFTGGLIASLAARIPHKVAMEMLLLCRTLGAQRAYEVGFANEVVPVGQQVTRALALAREMTAFSPMVLRTLKRFVNDGVMAQGPSERMARANRDLAMVRDSEDAREAKLAFAQKRKPQFTGR
ncbi:MAG: enoyl-CoA hydratase-related protein [Betaproteobacteria bacterium]|jgi:enoyl-CoA hydratase